MVQRNTHLGRMQFRVVNFFVVVLFFWCQRQTVASISGAWTYMGEMCATGFFYRDTYAYADGTGGTSPGNSLSAAQAKASVQVCADAFKDDTSCSNVFIGIDPKDGHCWCVDARDKCTRKQKASIYQFRFVMCKFPTIECSHSAIRTLT